MSLLCENEKQIGKTEEKKWRKKDKKYKRALKSRKIIINRLLSLFCWFVCIFSSSTLAHTHKHTHSPSSNLIDHWVIILSKYSFIISQSISTITKELKWKENKKKNNKKKAPLLISFLAKRVQKMQTNCKGNYFKERMKRLRDFGFK